MQLFFSPHVILGFITILLIFSIGLHNLASYRQTRNQSFLLHSVTYFTGGSAFLLVLLPTIFRKPELFSPLFALGIALISFGVAFYLYLISSFYTRSFFMRLGIFGIAIAFGAFSIILIVLFPPTIIFTDRSWTAYQFPYPLQIALLILFFVSMVIGSFVFFSKSAREVADPYIRTKGMILGMGYLFLAMGVFLAVLGEAILFNFLFVIGYGAIFLLTFMERFQRHP